MDQQPLFSENVYSAWKDVEETFSERGVQYTDTWRDCRWHCLIAVIREWLGWCNPEEDLLRALAAAVFVDIKYARLAGKYKEDTPIDLTAYTANFISQMRKLKKSKEAHEEWNEEVSTVRGY